MNTPLFLTCVGLCVPVLLFVATAIWRLAATLHELASTVKVLAASHHEERVTNADTRERVIALEAKLEPNVLPMRRPSPSRP